MEIRVHIAVLVIAADPNRADAAAADAVAQKAVGAGHSIVARVTVRDDVDAIRDQLKSWIDDSEIDVAIVTAGADTKHASEALKPLVHEAVPGFTDLFRWLAFQEIGASAMMAAAEAARCGTTFVFVLPAVANAAATAMDKLILPQLDVRATTRNLVAQMPRLQHLSPTAGQSATLVPSAPIVADAQIDKTEAVPHAVTMERTESGPGLSPRLPAANIVRKPEPVKPPKRQQEEATRIISQDQLERKIAQSNQHDAVTKPNVDIAKLLPRVPPGADDFDDAETADIADVLSGHRPKAPTPAKPLNIVRKPPTVQIPARTKPPSNAPIMLKRDESGRVVIPAKDTASGPIGKAKLPARTELSADDEAPTVPSKTPAKIADAMKAEKPAEAPAPAPVREPSKPIEIAKLAEALEQHDAALAKSPRISTSMPIDESQLEEVEEPATLPKPRVAVSTPPPLPVVVESRARNREPTPLPLLPKRKEDDTLPVGKFVYPTKQSGNGKRIAIFLLLAVVAAAGGIAFVRFVIQKPASEPKQELAVAPAIDAADVVAPPDVAIEVPIDAADIPEIDIEPGSAAVMTPSHPTAHPNHPIVAPPATHVDAGVAVATTIDAGEVIEDGCDEVTCVTTHYEKPCCARWKPADDNFRPHAGIAETLDKVMVREAMDNVKPRVIACGEQNPAKGIVKLAVAVGGDGTVKSVSVVDAPLPALGTCVAAAVKEAQFAKTGKGGSFNYPFAF